MNVIASVLFQRESNLIIFWTYHFEITSSPASIEILSMKVKKQVVVFIFWILGFCTCI
jgi:hypothetical protein